MAVTALEPTITTTKGAINAALILVRPIGKPTQKVIRVREVHEGTRHCTSIAETGE
jgi:hypothetical protein